MFTQFSDKLWRFPIFWLWVAVVILVPVLSVFGRSLQYWVADILGYRVAAWVIGLALLAAIILLIKYLMQKSVEVPYYHLSWFLPLFLIAPLFLERVEERLHFLTFGAFGALTFLLFSPRLAFLLCVVFSGADELLQYYLPDRVGDWRDVAMNGFASLSAAWFVRLWLRNVKNV